MVGVIGCGDEEAAAAHIARYVTKPVVAYIAGVTAPAGKRMGHAGAVISGGKGTAADKFRALEEAGARIVKSPAELGSAMAEMLGLHRRSRAAATMIAERPVAMRARASKASPLKKAANKGTAKPAASKAASRVTAAGRKSASKKSSPTRNKPAVKQATAKSTGRKAAK